MKHRDPHPHGHGAVLRLAILAFLVIIVPQCAHLSRVEGAASYPRGYPLPAVATPATVQLDRRVVHVKKTAYCPCTKCTGKTGPWFSRRTATGTLAAIADGVAADPRVLPLGTRIDIPGIGIRRVDDVFEDVTPRDRPAPPVRYAIDIRMPTHAEALAVGDPKLIRVTVLN